MRRDNSPDAWDQPNVPSRRAALRMFGVGAGALLAGCMGGDSDNESSNGNGEDDEVSGGTFRAPIGVNPSDQHYFAPTGTDFAYLAEPFVEEPGVWGRWYDESIHGQGELNYRLYDEVIVEDDRIEVTVSEDATWSNGDPILGRDVIIDAVEQRLHSGRMTFDNVNERGPQLASDATTGCDFDGKTGILYSDGGHFGDLVEQNIWRRLISGPYYNTQIEPYEAYADAMFDHMDMAENGEIDVWEDFDDLSGEVAEEYFGEDQSSEREEWIEYFRNPDNIVTSGAWTIDAFRENEMVLKPNEHHRYTDQINFDEIVLEHAGENNVVYSSLNAGRLDLAQWDVPQDVVTEVADSIEQFTAPIPGGLSLDMNHNHPHLGRRKVRQALQYAINTEQIATNLNPDTNEAITVPGGDVWEPGEWIDDDFVNETLISYENDEERATELMEEEGYSLSDDVWHDEDGNPFTVELTTEGNNTAVSRTIEEQLQEFGVDIEFVAIESGLFGDRFDNGELEMWLGSNGTGFLYDVARVYEQSWLSENGLNARNWLPEDIAEDIEYEGGWAVEQSPEGVSHITMEAPPIGEPDGELQEYEVMKMTRLHNASDEELTEFYPSLVWLLNWHVPTIPLVNQRAQLFANVEDWDWPTDSELWEYAGTVVPEGHLLSFGDQVSAD